MDPTWTYLRPFLERVCALGVDGIASVLLGFGAANFLGAAVAERMIRGSLHRTLSAMPLLMTALAFGLVLSGRSVLLASMIIAGWGFAFGVFPVAWATWIARTAPDETETAGGLQQAVNQTAITAAAGIGGVLLDTYGPRSPFVAAGTVTTLAAVLILAKLRPSGSRRKRVRRVRACRRRSRDADPGGRAAEADRRASSRWRAPASEVIRPTVETRHHAAPAQGWDPERRCTTLRRRRGPPAIRPGRFRDTIFSGFAPRCTISLRNIRANLFFSSSEHPHAIR